MKKSIIGSGLVLALALAGCATPPPAQTGAPTSTSTVAQSNFLACMVSDSGGFDDKSFNQTSHKGLLDAKEKLGVQIKDVQSKTNSDFAPNIQAMVDAKCNIIVTVGFLLGDATKAAAEKNPDIKFAIVDFAYSDETGKNTAPANLKGLVFNTGEPAFLAGYAAASMSQSGKVGTFGGLKIPSVTAFMEGYAQGVKYFNEKKGKSVQVLGWDSAKADGQFIPGASPFEDIAGGKRVAQALADQGADLIMPVAGPAGEGGLQVAQASGGRIAAIWVDTDGFVSQPNYSSVIFTSVGKAMDVAVLEAVKAAQGGTFDNDPFVGTLKNSGAYLAPFHNFDPKVSAETRAELKQIEADIVAGTLTVKA